MRTAIYLAITKHLKDAKIGVNCISLWNSNTTELTKQKAFKTPAVFVQFEPIQWGQLGGGVKEADIRIRLHIVTKTLATPEQGSKYQAEALRHIEVEESITTTMSGFAGVGFNAFQHTDSVPDHNHEQIIHEEVVFVTHAKTASTKKAPVVITGATVGIK